MLGRVHKALRVAPVSARYARSQGRMDWNDICSRGSNILGANRRLANVKNSMVQENNQDAAYMYVHINSFDTYSDRHVP